MEGKYRLEVKTFIQLKLLLKSTQFYYKEISKKNYPNYIRIFKNPMFYLNCRP